MNKTNIFAMITGILIGSTLCGAAHAAEGWFKAAPSAQTFWIGGRPVDLEAYVINGNNYVKLRDVGQVVGFEVNYDAATNRVLIGNRTAEPDCTVQVSPAIFTDTLTEGVYNGIRDSIVHREEILAGNYEPIPLKGADSPDDLVSLAITIGMWPNYCFTRNEAGDVVCRSRYAPAFQSAADHCRPFIDSLAGLSDREKVRRIDFYVCDRMTYAPRNAGIDDILTQDGVVSSYCMNYAYCFKFLWSLELYQQLNARLWRQGQKNTVIIHHIITKGTHDEDVIRALENKDVRQSALIAAVKARIGG